MQRSLLSLPLAWFAIILCAVSRAGAADAATGAISGRVLNVATGQYLGNARVAVRGTDLVAFTDQTGAFRLPRVPGGTVTLDVFYTGLDPQQVPVQVPPGGTVERNIDLTSIARYGETHQLDAFTVAAARETDSEAIAINEQRFAPNIKNVIPADALGDLMDGNVGEFLKFLPGLVAEYDSEGGGSVSSISVRGFPTAMAVVSSDGAQLANTGNATGSSRVFQFGQVSINNVSRLEVTKIPTPSTPAGSMGGSVNMVTKSAFERKDARLSYSVSLSANHEDLAFGKQPHASDERIWKILPSFAFDYTLPVTRNFGLVATGSSTNRFTNQHRVRKIFNAGGTSTGASFARPFLQTLHLTTGPRVNNRHSAGLRADWRPHRNGVLSATLEVGRFVSDRPSQNINFGTGTNGTPTPASGVPMSFGDSFTQGATGRGSVAILGDTAVVQQLLTTQAGKLRYRFDNGDWRIEAGAGASISYGGYLDSANGTFRQFGIAMASPVRVTLADYDDVRARTIRVYDNSNREVDLYDLRNYRLNTANIQPRDIDDHLRNAKLDVRKGLGFLPFPAAVQLGGAYREQTHDVRRYNTTWNYTPPDGDFSPARFATTNYVNRYDGFGFRNLPWIAPAKVWAAFQQNPAIFTKTAAQTVSEESNRIQNSEWLNEAVTGTYLQGEASLWQNRLRLLGGVRFETTTAEGRGPWYDPAAVWLRDPDGSFTRDARGQRIRRPDAGATGSMQELLLTRAERKAYGKRTYDGYYPSLHFTFQIRENLLGRAAYAQTYGRPDFSNIVPNSTIDEVDLDADTADPSLVRGRINIRNTGLKPWTAHNYDVSIEHYSEHGGLLSIGGFLKEVQDFFGSGVRTATAEDIQALGLDPRYTGWELATQYNVPGRATVRGLEINVRQPLRFLGSWGKHFQGFANATKLKLGGDRNTDFSGFIPETANWGLNFSRRPVSLMAKWNYRGKQQRSPQTSVNGYEYQLARLTLDLNAEVQLRRNLSAYATAQNVFNHYDTWQRYGPLTPEYAKTYETRGNGVQFMVGVKGTY
ncbi:MAG: TonB-dependent receptor [Verrucomicrobia bacterium]|nr:TonB-dependent receptor [Verrucomicrobiota bacterium]